MGEEGDGASLSFLPKRKGGKMEKDKRQMELFPETLPALQCELCGKKFPTHECWINNGKVTCIACFWSPHQEWREEQEDREELEDKEWEEDQKIIDRYFGAIE
jgi:hypothetical protein